MQQVPTRRTKTQKEQGQIKVNSSLSPQEANLTPEVNPEAMITPEVVAAIKMVAKEIMKEAVPRAGTDRSPITDLNPKAKVVTDVAKLIMINKTAISRKKLV